MVRYTGILPLNSRITIDYKKKEVNFGYPTIDKLTNFQIFKNVYLAFLMLWITCLSLFAVGYFVYTSITSEGTVTNTIYVNPLIQLISVLFTITLLYTGMMLFLPPLVPTVLSFKYHKICEIIPEVEKRFALFRRRGHYRAEFNGNGKRLIRIPLFRNTFLDYRTTGDYSKYIKKVEIKELPLLKIKRNKKIKQDSFWECLFHFEKKPKFGELVIDYI